MSDVSYAKARLREGTEILRTGGGIELTAAQCNALLDEYERLERLLVAHHAAGALDGVNVGDECPVCVR